ncbi:MAG: hypothetical protein ACREQ5_00800 [Candidatus Dormibacteria bacterium]
MTITDGEDTVLQRPSQDRRLALGIATELHTAQGGYTVTGVDEVLTDAGKIFEWLTSSGGQLHTMLRQVLNNQEAQMTLAGNLSAAVTAVQNEVAALQAEDGAVITALNDLLTKAQSQGSVSDADVQAAIDAVNTQAASIQAEVGNLTQAVQTAAPAPNPAPGTGP